MKTVLAVLILGVLLQDSDATYCLKYKESYLSGDFYFTYVYCDYSCCGTVLTTYCCSSWQDNDTDERLWSIGFIVGCAIGGFLFLCMIICFIVACAHAANKKRSRGNVVRPVNYSSQNANAAVTSSSAPPPYPGPGIHHPTPYAGASGNNHSTSFTGAAGYPLPNYAGLNF